MVVEHWGEAELSITPCLQTYIVGVEAAYFLFGASLTLFIH